MEKYKVDLEAAKSTDEDRTIEYIATKEIVDSMGRIFKVAGIDLSPLKQLKSIFWNHNIDDLPIGKATSIRKTGDEIRIKVQFATSDEYSFADTVYKLVRGKYINGGSVGITAEMSDVEYPEKPTKVNGKEVRMIVHKSQLKEFSITPRPANMAAVPLNASLDKAIEDKVIDEVEANEFRLICKEQGIDINTYNKEIENNTSVKMEQTNIDQIAVLKARVAELELQLKEQEMEEETKDCIYSKIYDEFFTKDENRDSVDELYDEYLEDKESSIDELYNEYLDK